MASDGSSREAHEAGGRAELPYRLRQQALMGAFARMALQTRDLDGLLARASELCAEALGAACCQVLEYRAGDHAFVIRACTGLGDERVGTGFSAADEATPASYAFRTGAGVLANGIQPGAEHDGARLHLPEALAPAGLCHAVNVPIALGDESRRAYGVLEAWGTDGHGFDRADQEFLAGFAGLIGIAVERHQGDARLRDALDHQVQLTREMSHRVKNSLATVAGLLSLQARTTEDQQARDALADARSRVEAVAQVHDQLWRQPDLAAVELSGFLGSLCEKLRESAPGHAITCEAPAMPIPADLAIPLGLFVNELVTNAIKYAYPGGHGPVRVEAVPEGEGRFRLSVSDDGVGLPEGFDTAAARRSLGMRVIHGLARQLGGELSVTGQGGACFSLTVNLAAA